MLEAKPPSDPRGLRITTRTRSALAARLGKGVRAFHGRTLFTVVHEQFRDRHLATTYAYSCWPANHALRAPDCTPPTFTCNVVAERPASLRWASPCRTAEHPCSSPRAMGFRRRVLSGGLDEGHRPPGDRIVEPHACRSSSGSPSRREGWQRLNYPSAAFSPFARGKFRHRRLGKVRFLQRNGAQKHGH